MIAFAKTPTQKTLVAGSARSVSEDAAGNSP